jgi:hypothetical protein
LSHEPLQQSPSAVQPSPSAPHSTGPLQLPLSQKPLQHSDESEQMSLSGAQNPATMPQVPVSHVPLQHSDALLHAEPSSLQPPTGAPQVPPAHTALQHSSSIEHPPLSGVHTKVPGVPGVPL